MAYYGKKNISCSKVEWVVGTGENTNLPDNSTAFNVVDQMGSLKETKRILLEMFVEP